MPVSSSSNSRSWNAAPAILLHQPRVRKLGLRILVERFLVGVGGSSVKVEVTLLHVLAVVALAVGEAEQPLLENGVLAIPQRGSEAEAALTVAPSQQAILAPAVGAAAGMVVRKIVPAGAVGRVILPDGCPTGAPTSTAPSASNSSGADCPAPGARIPPAHPQAAAAVSSSICLHSRPSRPISASAASGPHVPAA